MRTLRVLLVDGDAPLRRIMSIVLGRMPDVRIVSACASIEEALPYIAQGGIDLIIAEYWFPSVGDGPQPSVLDLLQHIPEGGPALVIHAGMPATVPAHLPQPLEMVLKPVSIPEMRAIVTRARDALQGRAP